MTNPATTNPATTGYATPSTADRYVHRRRRSNQNATGRTRVTTRIVALIAAFVTAGVFGVVTLGAIGTRAASAHATLQLYGTDATAGGYGVMFLRIPHGCGGRATDTDTVTVSVPAGFTSVKPEHKAGWQTTITRNNKGRITAITWHGGKLPDDHFEDFGISVKYPETPGTYHLATTQRCAAESIVWDQVAEPGADSARLERPAPSITVTDTHEGSTHPGDSHAGDEAASGKVIGKVIGRHAGTWSVPARAEVDALFFNGRLTVIADLPGTLRGRTARVVLEHDGTWHTLGWGRLDQDGDLTTGYPTTQSGPDGWRVSHGDVIAVTVDGKELARVTVEAKK